MNGWWDLTGPVPTNREVVSCFLRCALMKADCQSQETCSKTNLQIHLQNATFLPPRVKHQWNHLWGLWTALETIDVKRQSFCPASFSACIFMYAFSVLTCIVCSYINKPFTLCSVYLLLQFWHMSNCVKRVIWPSRLIDFVAHELLLLCNTDLLCFTTGVQTFTFLMPHYCRVITCTRSCEHFT